MGAFKLLPLQFRRWEWVYWIMDLFIGLEKKEEQQSWYQSGLKPLDLWGFSAIAGGSLNLPFISLGLIKTRPSVASSFHMQNVTFASSQLDLLKLDWSKNVRAGSAHLFANIRDEKGLRDEDLESHMQPLLGLHGTRRGFKVRSLQKTPAHVHMEAASVRWSICSLCDRVNGSTIRFFFLLAEVELRLRFADHLEEN